MMIKRLMSTGLVSLMVLVLARGQQLAFPGAEGFGKYTTGGRGGRVVEVTNLLDLTLFGQTEPGSLRAALNTSGDDPITIVFRVSGIIELRGELKSSRSNMTIAGQTAPGQGICIKNESIKLSGNNLIVRYLRFRPGDELEGQASGLNIENAQNVIVDHCSMSWAIEENATFYDTKNLTVQWCIISESLYNSFHSKGARGYAGQWGGQYASYHHNLLAHNSSRSPRINGSRAHDTLALVDFRNNVVYNWGRAGSIYGGEEEIPGGECQVNFVNNYYKPGSSTPSTHRFAAPSLVTDGNTSQGYAEWYFSGNYMEGTTGGMNDENWLGVDAGDVGGAENIRVDTEFEVEEIETETAAEALESVLANAGAILPARDDVDKRILAEVKGEVEVTGDGIIDSQTEVGGWPTYVSLPAPEDTDQDGMPDEWETENSLDPNDPEDGEAITTEGYSNLEIYLNSITETIILSAPEIKKNQVLMYPNPVREKIHFTTDQIIWQVEVFDISGKAVIISNPGNDHSLDVSHLDPGIYMVRLTLRDHGLIEQKIIKK